MAETVTCQYPKGSVNEWPNDFRHIPPCGAPAIERARTSDLPEGTEMPICERHAKRLKTLTERTGRSYISVPIQETSVVSDHDPSTDSGPPPSDRAPESSLG